MQAQRVGRLFVVAAGLALSACGSSTESANVPPGAVNQPRIVSLSPAISRTLVDLELARLVVGRTPYCASLDSSIPIVGDLLSLDYERLVRLRPTHVLIQPPATGIDPGLRRLGVEHKWTIGAWRLNDLDDIETLVRDVPGVIYKNDDEAMSQAMARSAQVLNGLASSLVPPPQPAWRGRTMLLSQIDPPLAFGAETYLDDVLRMLGAGNAVTEQGWVALTLEDVVRINPEAIIVVRLRDGPPMIGESAAGSLGAIVSLEIEAARSRRLAVLMHPEADLPCSSVVEVARRMSDLLRLLGARPSQ